MFVLLRHQYATYGLGAQFVGMYEQQKPSEWQYVIRDSNVDVLLVPNSNKMEKQMKETASTRRELAEKQGVALVKSIVTMDELAKDEKTARAVMEDKAARAHNGYFVDENVMDWNSLTVLADQIVPTVQADPQDVATLIYTSGTSGKPKGVMLTHENLVSNAYGTMKATSATIHPGHMSLNFLPWAHVFGQTVEVHASIASGVGAFLMIDPVDLIHKFPEVEPNLIFSVPAVFVRIRNGVMTKVLEGSSFKQSLFHSAMEVGKQVHGGGNVGLFTKLKYGFYDKLVLSKVRGMFGRNLQMSTSGGAALSPEVEEFFTALGIDLFNGYGLSETSPVITSNRPGASRPGTCGKALDESVTVHICDAEGNPLENGKQGEIVVSGPNVMKGYWNNEKETRAVLTVVDGKRAFKTGDMGVLSDDGYLTIVGRIKEQYKLLNGKYVVPTVIEDAIKHSRYVDQVMVYGEQMAHNVALIFPNLVNLRQWLKTNKGETQEMSDEMVLEHPLVQELMQQEIKTECRDLKHFEVPRMVKVLSHGFTVENGLATPKLSNRRKQIIERFQTEIDELKREIEQQDIREHKDDI
eukprot:TRINITY_DN625_c0_g1_i12.p1 TRINITY_DN625_c0_g1~~TRINITY_DN625_c0_g1_i12.p1  ORF type:complete len:580 (+),score=212.08 TRINITY_DN625_c0_g1_i12:105-1844(+)